jgi:CheY-like chemotaxis protein
MPPDASLPWRARLRSALAMSETSAKPLVLLVEDDLAYGLLMRQALELAGFRVVIVGTGWLALQEMERERVAVLVADLALPELQRLEFIELAKRRFPDTRIIALCGESRAGDGGYRRLAEIFGAHVTLQKPFPDSALVQAAMPPEHSSP